MLSYLLKVKPGLKIRTESDLVTAHRHKAVNKTWSMAPDSVRIRELVEKFNIPLAPKPDGCIRCRLCVRAIAMAKAETETSSESKCRPESHRL